MMISSKIIRFLVDSLYLLFLLYKLIYCNNIYYETDIAWFIWVFEIIANVHHMPKWLNTVCDGDLLILRCTAPQTAATGFHHYKLQAPCMCIQSV